MPWEPTGGALLRGRYRLGDCLGVGGMGVVFQAVDERDGSRLALKLIDRREARPGEVDRFKREFRAAARLGHPHCVRVFDLDQEEGRWFFTMEFVAGGRLEPRRRSPQAAAAIGLQILSALDHLHARQIVHRDIKPQNVLVGSTGPGDSALVKLCDFGISKPASLTEDAAVGDLIGSLRYLAPEQAESGLADVRADLYALGVVLYELLAGRHPLPPLPSRTSLDSAAMRRFVGAPPTPLLEAAPDQPAELAALVMRLLEKDPLRRPFAAADVFDELADWLRGHPPDWPLPELPPLERKPQLAHPRFVGRAQEMLQLGRFLDGAWGEGGADRRLLLVSGPPGAGKSRLMNQALKLAEARGARLQVATCSAEAGFPLAAMAALLRPQEVSAYEPTLASGAAGTTGSSTRKRSGPVLSSEELRLLDAQQPLERGSTPSGSGSGNARTGGVEAPVGQAELWRFQRDLCAQVLAASRERPTLILVEDAQWADAATLQLLGFLVRVAQISQEAGEPARLALLVSHRPAPGHAALAELAKAAADRIELQPLAPGDSTELLASMLQVEADPRVAAFTEALQARTAGNPLFLAEALHALLASGQLRRQGRGWDLDRALVSGSHLPSTLRDAIGDRAARLWVGTKRMLEAAAVAGRRFDAELLAAATGMDPGDLLDGFDEAIRAGFIEERGGGEPGYLFSHDRFRESIYERLPAEEAARLHAAVAGVLEGQLRRHPERAVDAAHHFERAGNPAKAYRCGVLAAERAMTSLAFAEAVEFYRRAIANGRAAGGTVPGRALERYGDACLASGEYDVAEKAFLERLAGPRRPLRRSELLRKLAEVEYRRGNVRRATERLEQVLAEVGAQPPRSRVGMALLLLLRLAQFFRRLFWPRRAPPLRLDKGARLKLEVAFRTQIRLAEIHYYKDMLGGLYYQAASLETAERTGLPALRAHAWAQQGYPFALFGFYGLARRCFARAAPDEAEAPRTVQSWAAVLRALALTCEGRGAEAEAENARAVQLASVDPMMLRQITGSHAHLLLSIGKIDEAERVARRMLRLSEEFPDVRTRGWAHSFLAVVADRRGDRRGAEAYNRRAIDDLQQDDDRLARLCTAMSLARLLAIEGRIEEALDLAVATADAYLPLRLRHPNGTAEADFVSVAALRRKAGPVDATLRARVRRVGRRGAVVARSIRFAEPALLASQAAWAAAEGRVEEGRAGFQHALALAERLRIAGHVYDIHVLASRIFDGAEGRRHAALAAQLSGSFGAGPAPDRAVA